MRQKSTLDRNLNVIGATNSPQNKNIRQVNTNEVPIENQQNNIAEETSTSDSSEFGIQSQDNQEYPEEKLAILKTKYEEDLNNLWNRKKKLDDGILKERASITANIEISRKVSEEKICHNRRLNTTKPNYKR